MDFLLQRSLLANPRLLRRYASGAWPDDAEISRLCYIEARDSWRDAPDYMLKNQRTLAFGPNPQLARVLLKSIADLGSDCLCFRGQALHVKTSAHAAWQDLLTWLAPLPLCAHAVWQQFGGNGLAATELSEAVKLTFAKTSLPTIFDTALDRRIRDQGLTEAHLHLNLSTETDWIWQDALEQPGPFSRAVTAAPLAEVVEEQYLQVDDLLDRGSLLSLLSFAVCLRDFLARRITVQLRPGATAPISANRLKEATTLPGLGDYTTYFPERTHPVVMFRPAAAGLNGLQKEALLLIHACHAIAATQDAFMAQVLHYYLLILNHLNSLVVQQLNQKGFDQFQKITMNELRSLSERSYVRRFSQLEGMYDQDIALLEGRFSPQNRMTDCIALFRRILGGYSKYQDQESEPREEFPVENPSVLAGDAPLPGKKRMRLNLVSHFIKKPHETVFSGCQYYALRKTIKEQARLLVRARGESGRIGRRLVGFDAAANEMHAPPEVFAPAFRLLRKQGFTNFTFHAGEDFVHLLSGMRAAYEAMVFLGLGMKNRLGHATALGIAPKLWRERAGESVPIRTAEWLDNLVFAWDILKTSGGFVAELQNIEREIAKLSNRVYGGSPAPDLLRRAWSLRWIDPLRTIVESRELSPDFDAAERKMQEEIKENSGDQEAFGLYKAYHTEEIAMRWYVENRRLGKDFFMKAPSGFLPDAAMRHIQERVISELNARDMAIETPPTSNVRISFYRNYGEHHLFSWLGLGPNPFSVRPRVCIGSDDTGVFSTFLRNEYAHILRTLQEEFTLSPDESMKRIETLTQTARDFAFD